MKVVVDTNIVFSAILNSDGKIGDLLLNSGRYYRTSIPQNICVTSLVITMKSYLKYQNNLLIKLLIPNIL